MPSKSKRSLQDVVGKETYSVWVDMLRELVLDGRTHRLSVVMSLIDASEAGYPERIKELIHDIVGKLFKDAGVK